MSIWTLEQIVRAGQVWARGFDVDAAVYADRAEAIVSDLVRELRSALVDAGVPARREPRRDEVSVTRRYVSAFARDEFTVLWAPKTHNVELHGGPAEGEVLTRPALEPFNVKARTTIASWADSGLPALTSDLKTTYVLAGWNEDTARWVFRPTTSV